MNKPTIADRLRAAGISPTKEQLAAAEKAFAEPSARETYLRLRAENPIAAAEFASRNPDAYTGGDK